MSELKVSVLMPVYNVEHWLEQSLDSVLSQTLTDIELICVNDGSNDGSQAILERYASADSRVKIIVSPENEGLMMARRRGYEAAKGKYLFFCDSDDLLPGNTLARLYDAAISSDADIIAGDLALYREGKTAVRSRAKIGDTWKSYQYAILDGTTCSLCGALFNRRLFHDVSYVILPHCNYSEDRVLQIQILDKKRPSVLYVPQVTYYYRINQSSLTRVTLSDEALSAQISALNWSYRYIYDNYVGDEEMRRYNDRFIWRYLGYYIECGYDSRLIFGAIHDRYDWGLILRAVGVRLSTHIFLCAKCGVYRTLAHSCRRIIRRFQGKD